MFLTAVAAKAPRKSLGASSAAGSSTSPTSGNKSNKYGGGNPAVYHETPEWQKSVSDFFIKKAPSESKSAKKSEKENVNPENEEVEKEEEAAGGSSSTPQR